MCPYPWTHVGTPSQLGHMDRMAATMPSQAHAGAAQEAPDIGQWEGQDVPLVRPSSCIIKGGIPSSRRYLPTYLRYASKTNYCTENYQLARHVLENGLAALQVNLDEIQVELFASQQQHIMQLYRSKQLNNAFCLFRKAMGLAYANPPFSLLAKVLTKIAYEGGRVVMCTPDWGCSGEHAYCRRMLDRMTVGRVQLPDGPIYVPEDSDTAMQAPEWASFLCIVDGSLNPVLLCDLDQVLLKEVMAENCGLTLFALKNRSPEHLSATLTGCESPEDYLEPAAVKEDADDQLSEKPALSLLLIPAVLT